jgi:group I intron endonuclease
MIVYTATNVENGKNYVGQTSMSLRKRLYKHSYDAKKGSSSLFHRAVRKHGLDSFEVQAVFETGNRESINNAEKVWIILLQADNSKFGYNLTAGGEGGQPTPEIREKMSQKKLGNAVEIERVRQMGFASRGRRSSKELKAHLSKVHSGENNAFFGRRHSEESKLKMRLARAKRREKTI